MPDIIRTRSHAYQRERLKPFFQFLLIVFVVTLATACTPQKSNRARVSIEIGDDPVIGNRDANIAIIEFVDLECSFCLRFHRENFPAIKKRFIDSNEVLLIVKDLPLRRHKHAFSAALIANCAAQQGAYWRMQDYLINRQNRLGKKLYEQAMLELGLDREQLVKCARQESRSREILGDMRSARRLGIRGTPSFAIGRLANGRVEVTGIARGIPSMEELERQIRKISAHID